MNWRCKLCNAEFISLGQIFSHLRDDHQIEGSLDEYVEELPHKTSLKDYKGQPPVKIGSVPPTTMPEQQEILQNILDELHALNIDHDSLGKEQYEHLMVTLKSMEARLDGIARDTPQLKVVELPDDKKTRQEELLEEARVYTEMYKDLKRDVQMILYREWQGLLGIVNELRKPIIDDDELEQIEHALGVDIQTIAMKYANPHNRK